MQLDDTRWWIDGEEFGFLLDDILISLSESAAVFWLTPWGGIKVHGPIASGTGTQMGKQ